MAVSPVCGRSTARHSACSDGCPLLIPPRPMAMVVSLYSSFPGVPAGTKRSRGVSRKAASRRSSPLGQPAPPVTRWANSARASQPMSLASRGGQDLRQRQAPARQERTLQAPGRGDHLRLCGPRLIEVGLARLRMEQPNSRRARAQVLTRLEQQVRRAIAGGNHLKNQIRCHGNRYLVLVLRKKMCREDNRDIGAANRCRTELKIGLAGYKTQAMLCGEFVKAGSEA